VTKPSKATLWRLALGLLAGLALIWLLLHRGGPRPLEPVPGPAQQATPMPQVKPGPRLAIVLDDWGYNARGFDYLPRYPGRLTLAVLPGLEYSRRAVEAAKAAGHEVILHMPLESHLALPQELHTLKVGMSQPELEAILGRDLDSLPEAVGVNNHEGSKGSESAPLMAAVMAVLKARGLYFVDSRTSAASVAEQEAARAGLAHASRDVFLDHDERPEAILAALRKAIGLAKKRGACIAIGHPRPATLKVLAAAELELRASGVSLVGLSQVLKPAQP